MDIEKDYLREFIQVYHDHPSLWDITHEEYKMKNQKVTGYMKLLRIFRKIKRDATIEDVKRKINSLRSSFRRETKKKIKAKELGRVYKPTVWWYELMNFIRNYEESLPKVPAVYLPAIKQIKNSSEDEIEEETYQEEELYSYNDMEEVKSPKQERKLNIKPDVLTDQKSNTQYIREEDTFDQLSKIWANKLRKIPHTQRLLAEKSINDILFEAEMGTLKRYSVKINESDFNVSYAPISTIQQTPDHENNEI